VGIPAGGLFSGAEEPKTEEQAAVYGGTAGEPYDPCYHEPCDNKTNLSVQALNELSDGAAHATFTYAEAGQVLVGANRGGAARSAADTYDEFKGPQALR